MLEFDDIANAVLMIGGDADDVSNWNSFFDLPTNGTVFTSAEIQGNCVVLFGGGNMTLKDDLFDITQYARNLLSFIDTRGVVVATGYCPFGWSDSYYEGCENLVTVVLSAVTNLGDLCFSGCSLMQSIEAPMVVSVGSQVFEYCSSLTELDFQFLTDIGETWSTCSGCTNLVTFTAPLLTSLSTMMFAYCWSLIEVNVPFTSIPTSCFYQCYSLTQDSADFSIVTTVASYAFYECTNITHLEFAIATTFGDGCFGYCTSIEDLYLYSCTSLGSTVGDDSVFTGITGNTINLYVPNDILTCNGGNPDGDVQYLQANNTVFLY